MQPQTWVGRRFEMSLTLRHPARRTWIGDSMIVTKLVHDLDPTPSSMWNGKNSRRLLDLCSIVPSQMPTLEDAQIQKDHGRKEGGEGVFALS